MEQRLLSTDRFGWYFGIFWVLGVFCVPMGSSPVMTRDYQPWVSMDAEIYQGTWMNHVYPMR